MLFNKRLMSVTIASTLMLSTSANAGTVSYSAAYGSGQTPVLTDWFIVLNLPEFNNISGAFAGDTLNSATIYYGGEVISSFTVSNHGISTSKISLYTAAELDFGNNATVNEDGATVSGELFGASLNPTYTLAKQTLAAGSTKSYGPFTNSEPSNANPAINITNPAAVTGAGAFSVNVDALGNSYAVGSGNFSSAITTVAEADITVVYNYTAHSKATVPEPVGLALLAAGVAGLGFRTNKK